MPVVFVGGSGRSGTTLVQKVLCEHSLIAGGPEFDHLVPISELFERVSQPWRLERQAWYYTPSELRERFRSFVDSLFDGVRHRNPEALHLVEKTPANIAVANTLLGLFKESRFIHVVRDGRDVLASHKKVGRRLAATDWHTEKSLGDFATTEVCRRWNRNADQARACENGPHSNRFLTCRYEQLVSSPVETVERLCEFIGVGAEPNMLRPERADVSATAHEVSIDGVWYTNEQFGQPINTRSVGVWRTDLNLRERLLSNLHMEPNLTALGYSVAPAYQSVRGFVDSVRRRASAPAAPTWPTLDAE